MAATAGEVHRLAREVIARIVAGAYPAGLRLPSEKDLALEFHCGRSTVREALRHLTDLGLLRSRRGSGAMVLDFRREGSPALLPALFEHGSFERPPLVVASELLRLRAMMACEAVRLAARYGTREGLAEARQRLAEASLLRADPLAHATKELELYRALVASSGIWPAVWMVNSFWAPLKELLRLIEEVLTPVPEGFDAAIRQMLALVERGAEREAVALAHRWFEQVDAETLGLFAELLGGLAPRTDGPSAAAERKVKAEGTAGRKPRPKR
jgi:DNA-binding FadR family transcriptional regulator